jgi:hypothetical protein
MSEWNVQDFVSLCYEKGISNKHPGLSDYLTAVLQSLRQADLHAEDAKQAGRSWIESGKFDLVPERRERVVYETQIRAYICDLDSVADKLGQVINLVVLDGALDEEKVYFGKVVDCLDEKRNAPQVKDSMEKFRDSHEFRYLHAFCNLIQHGRPPKWGIRIEYRQDKFLSADMTLSAFEYKGKKYPKVWASDVLEYRYRVREALADIELSLNDFVKGFPS